MREITTHTVNGLNAALRIVVEDESGEGNACHLYRIEKASGSNPTDPLFPLDGLLACIAFQNGPIKERDVNGISNEALLAIVRDRLEGFQSGPYACTENDLALSAVCGAMEALAMRTKQRLARGVEGKNIV